ncbi:hypothetical protein L195_g063572, partial [Trifolium pratense]
MPSHAPARAGAASGRGHSRTVHHLLHPVAGKR